MNLLRNHVMLWGVLTVAGTIPAMSAATAADRPSESQLERLMETAAEAPDSPDHDYVSNSLHSMLQQSQNLNLSREQTDHIKTITDQYERTKRDREQAYRQSEMETLKLIHDSHSSMSAIETAVHKTDEEHGKLRLAGIKALRDARDVLRPEQYDKWRQSHAAKQAAQSGTHRQASRFNEEDASRLAPH